MSPLNDPGREMAETSAFFSSTDVVLSSTVTKKYGFSNKVQKTIEENSLGGTPPWFVLVCGAEGSLAAYENELLIVKTGAMSGLLTGATGGGRITHFPYRQVTAVEYNAGFMMGVLEILTASYSGDTNRDFWTVNRANRGTSDPRQQNNTLPLDKQTFKLVTPQINKLKQMIEAVHSKQSGTTVINNSASLADELEKLSALVEKGILSQAEFEAAKKKLIADLK
jgi:hypothetical protein